MLSDWHQGPVCSRASVPLSQLQLPKRVVTNDHMLCREGG